MYGLGLDKSDMLYITLVIQYVRNKKIMWRVVIAKYSEYRSCYLNSMPCVVLLYYLQNSKIFNFFPLIVLFIVVKTAWKRHHIRAAVTENWSTPWENSLLYTVTKTSSVYRRCRENEDTCQWEIRSECLQLQPTAVLNREFCCYNWVGLRPLSLLRPLEFGHKKKHKQQL